jgi:hypothetical protein
MSKDSIRQEIFPLRESLDNQVYTIIATQIGSSLISSATVPTFNAIALSLSGFDDQAAYTSVFDQYRITLVKVTFIPDVDFNSSNAVSYGRLTTVVDYDDAAVLASEAAALDYSNAVTGAGYDPQTRVFRPHVAIAAYSGAFTSFANEESPWLDCASNAVLHYGVKTAWAATTVVSTIRTVVHAVLQFRNVR